MMASDFCCMIEKRSARCHSGFYFLLLTIWLSPPLIAQVKLNNTLLAAFTNDAIEVDGMLNDPIWLKAEKTTQFYMNFPKSGLVSPDSLKAEVQVAFTSSTIFIGATCYGSLPNGVFSLKRDDPVFWEGEVFGIVIDPINAKNSGYVFGINPKGVQADAILDNQNIAQNADLTRAINSSWNAIWQGKTKKHGNHWTIELAIPLKIINRTKKDVWGINFFRRHVQSNTKHSWSPVPVQFQEVQLDYTGQLMGLNSIKAGKFNMAASPYTLLRHVRDHKSDEKGNSSVEVGGNLRIGITKGLNLDVTLNPDFSQVDVDRQVTNLSTVNIRFPEQRLFFLENSDIFSNFGIPPMRPFFSRRIGLDNTNNPIPIRFGAKLSGSVTDHLRIGMMNIQTDRTSEQSAKNYSSLAFNQKLFKRFLVKGYFHNIQHTGNEPLSEDGRFNRIGGIELDYRSGDGKYRGSWGYGLSTYPKTKGENGFYKLELGYSGQKFAFFTNISGVGNNYRNEIGFFPRNFHFDANSGQSVRFGFNHVFTRVNYTIFPKKGTVNLHEFGLRNVYTATKEGMAFRYDWVTSYKLQWKNTSQLDIAYAILRPQLLFPFAFTDGPPLAAGFYHYNFGNIEYSSDKRKSLRYGVGFQYGGFYNGKRIQYRFDLDYRLNPWGLFSVNASLDDLRFPTPFASAKYWLVGTKTQINFSKSLFWTTFVQYNTQLANFNVNTRFQWQINALSNLFIVYTDNYGVNPWEKKNKTLVIKLNYWFAL